MKIMPKHKINFGEQITVWDIETTKQPKKITEKAVCVTETINKVTAKEIEKTGDHLEPTEKQQQFLVKHRIMGNGNLSRLIKYCGGSLGIEMLLSEGYKIIYVNAEGQEEFSKNKKFPVLPMDKIIYYNGTFKANLLQEEKLKVLKTQYKDLKEIRRKGDENILVEVPGKIISINPKGWVLEFQNVKAIYEKDEVVNENIVEDLEVIQSKVKPGDYVQAQYGAELIEGNITREYGLGDEILNISFDNDTRCTAIGRTFVTKILKAA